MNARRRAAIMVLATGWGMSSPLWAQSEFQDDPAPDVIELPEAEREVPRAAAGRVLEEIVVTAQKVEQTLAEVPVAVSVVDGTQLRDAGVFGPEGIENYVPNVELDTDPQAPTIGIRGFSTDTYNVGLEPSVGIIVDEIPLARTEFIPDGLFDIGRVEVLRGPQGTLFGKNTIAGVLIFASKAPAQEAGGNLILTGGELGEKRIEAALDLPLGDSLSARASVVGWRDPGDVKNRVLGRRELKSSQDAARLRFAWDNGGPLAFRFGGQFSETFVNYSPWQLYDLDPDALEYARSKDPKAEDDPFDFETGFDLPGFVERDSHILHAIADYDANDWLRLSVIAGVAGAGNDILMDFDVSAADLVRVDVLAEFSQQSLELRLTGSREIWGRWVDIVAGLFAFDAKTDIAVTVDLGEDIANFGPTAAGQEALGSPQGAPLPPLPLPLPQGTMDDGVDQAFGQESLSLAAFGQLTVSLSDRLSVIAGVRVGQEDKDALLMVATRPQPEQASLTGSIVGAGNFTRPLSRSESELSPKLGLLYEQDDYSIYATWTRGFKGGGFNGISFADENEGDPLGAQTPVQLEFEPERGDNYELGVKARLAGGAMQLNATVYNTDVSNMQVTSFNGISFDVFNAAEARLQGFEADLHWLTPWPWLELRSALAIASAEYLSYPDAPAAAESDDGSGEQDLAGKTLPKAPKITFALNPQLSFPVSDSLGLQWGLDFSYRGDQYLETDLDSHSFQKAHWLLGSYVNIGPEHGAWGLTLRGENLTNTEALAFVSDHNLYANSYFSAQIPPRRVSLSVIANW